MSPKDPKKYVFPIEGGSALLRQATAGSARSRTTQEISNKVAAWSALLGIVGELFESYGFRAHDATSRHSMFDDAPCVWRFARPSTGKWVLVTVAENGEVKLQADVEQRRWLIEVSIPVVWDRRDQTLVGRALAIRDATSPGAPPVYTSPVEELVGLLIAQLECLQSEQP